MGERCEYHATSNHRAINNRPKPIQHRSDGMAEKPRWSFNLGYVVLCEREGVARHPGRVCHHHSARLLNRHRPRNTTYRWELLRYRVLNEDMGALQIINTVFNDHNGKKLIVPYLVRRCKIAMMEALNKNQCSGGNPASL